MRVQAFQARKAVDLLCSIVAGLLILSSVAGAAPYVWTSPPDDVDPQTVADAWSPRLAVTPDGTVWCAWMGVDPVEWDEEVLYSRWNGAGWDPPATVHPANGTDDRFPELAVSRGGDLWCLYKTPTASVAGAYSGLASHWTGTGWSYPDTVWTDGSRWDECRLAPVSGTEAWFARSGSTGPTNDVFLYHMVNGVTEPPYQYVEPDSDEMYPGIAVDGEGVPWAAWSQIPPLSPPNSQIMVTRYVSGAWEAPQRLPEPLGIVGLWFLTAPPNEKWIACLAENGSLEPGAWAVHWTGSGWSPAVRVSDPITSNDSTQYHISASRNPSRNPRIVWVRANKLNYTRRDMLTSTWNGTGWTPPALVGNLADSGFVQFPDVAEQGADSIWVSYMLAPPRSPLWHAMTTHTVLVETAASSVDLMAALEVRGVALQWSLQLDPRTVRALRILRAPGAFSPMESEAPRTASVVATLASPQGREGGLLDADWSGEGAQVSYWLEAVMEGGSSLWAGPREISARAPSGSRLTHARPNPFNGTVMISGVSGSAPPEAVEIFDPAGRLVRVLRPSVAEWTRAGPEFSVIWDGRAADGSAAASGVYIARLRTAEPGTARSLRLVLVK